MFNKIRFFKTISHKILPLFSSFTRYAFHSKNLVYTNGIMSFGLSGLGDVIEQTYEIHIKQQETWNHTRTLKMSTTGLIIGVFCHHWYHFLDGYMPARTINSTVIKVLVDQILFSPICIWTFFVTIAIMENTPFDTFCKELAEKGWQLYRAEWLVWPMAQFVNFYIMPYKYRVIYDNMVSLGYDVYTSQVKYGQKNTVDNEEDNKTN